jgi:hypothetical protein
MEWCADPESKDIPKVSFWRAASTESSRTVAGSVDQTRPGLRKSVLARNRPHSNGFGGGPAPRVAQEVAAYLPQPALFSCSHFCLPQLLSHILILRLILATLIRL